MKPKCKPGDLAVVINADIRSNLGSIVRVIETHDGSGPIRFDFEGKVWRVSCEHTMTWTLNGVTYRMNEGPVPDWRLQPIRGLQQTEASAVLMQSGFDDAPIFG